ncbi:MAG: SpoIID/LytB domain-containing protein, partial [Calditrichaeota bacterium]|nr:SpoIID/LytB domain-containing protein [Calditrichota bacterium]
LRGVVPAEMWTSAPEEALKAQAVVARSTALVLLRRCPPGATYDFCSTQRCQVYRGVDVWSRATERAIRATRGEVLTNQGKVCEAPYSAVCGGHTEDASLLWTGERQDHLRGVLDAPVVGRLDLRNEKTLQRWINSRPKVFCSPDLSGDPAARKYFRWTVRVSEQTLRRRVRASTGVDVGIPVRIRVLRRGVSGRALSVLVSGPLGRVKIEGELRIRRGLAAKALPSSCFIVQKDGSDFRFSGAGFGHGVGMCQAGAVGMARAGRNYREILKHYYPGTRVARKY